MWPVAVQGEGSAKQISNAIDKFNQFTDETTIKKPDLLIVARGGGSLEDLWSFNEEIVVRSVLKVLYQLYQLLVTKLIQH